MDEDPYDMGYDAFGAGKLESDNPFSLEDEEGSHMSWNDGWNEAAEEAAEDD